MTRYFAALTIVLLPVLVLARVLFMSKHGIKALKFGDIDKRDFLILPFVLFYFYIVFSATFDFHNVRSYELFRSVIASRIGVLFCLSGLVLLIWSLVSFGRSFRVGIDTEHPDKLVTTGIFALSRNPVYVAFAFILIGEFLVFPNWMLLIYLGAAIWLFHRQVILEEEYLSKNYGREYVEYRNRVRRYL